MSKLRYAGSKMRQPIDQIAHFIDLWNAHKIDIEELCKRDEVDAYLTEFDVTDFNKANQPAEREYRIRFVITEEGHDSHI